MGSGFSGCTGASSVGVTEVGGKQSLNKSGGGVHSDSCDSGISIGDGNKKSRSSYRHTATSRHVAGELDSEEEMMVAGSEVGCGTDFLMTSTPRAGATTTTASTTKLADVAEHPDTMSPSHTSRKSRNAHSRSRTSSLRHNPNSAPNLLEHAIHEEDEDAFDGEPEDKRLRAQRPPRPKSAHFKKSRAGNSQRGRTARSRQLNQHVGSASGGDSSAEVTSDEGEDDFDSDILSIPDETSPHVTRPNTLTTIRLGPQFQAQTKIQDHDGHGNDKNEDMDWWAEDDGGSTARTSRDGGRDSSRSRASSSFTLRSHSRVWPEGRVAKKASERSISSILLTTAVELDSSPATAATNPACFAVTNPEITQHILKCLQEIEQDLRAATLTLCAKEEVTREDYYHAVMSLRPRFLRLLGDFKMASGEVLGRLPLECQHIVQLEEYMAQRVMEMAGDSSGLWELGPLVTQHLQDLEELCEREAFLPVGPIRPLVMPADRQQALWDESGVEDESDSAEEDLQGPGINDFDCEGEADKAGVSHDGHVMKDAGDAPSLSSLPPRASCKSARPASLASSMSSSRARSSARRPPTETRVLSGSKVHTVIESEGSIAGSSTATTTTTNATSPASRCSTSKGGCKSRPDSGIVVSSCSASYSSSEATRETDGDLAAQTDWIAKSLEMLEQILQVRTENHQTTESLVDAITHGSTSEQLKAHALYRWLTSQSMVYYGKCKTAKANSPTGKLRQVSEGKMCYAALYQELAKAAGLKCEKIDGYAKVPDYRPGTPMSTNASNNPYKHSWNAVLLGGHYHFLDAGFGALPCKFFVEHFFMTPPDEMRLSHFPKDKRWLLMTQSLSVHDFESTLKTWPTMFAFNIRPLNMKSVLRSYDGRLSITVLLRNVAVTPQLEYVGPGTPQDTDALAFNIDQEIRNVDNAETFHLNLPEEGTYYFTLMVHDLEEDEDIPAFQYRVDYKDELL